MYISLAPSWMCLFALSWALSPGDNLTTHAVELATLGPASSVPNKVMAYKMSRATYDVVIVEVSSFVWENYSEGSVIPSWPLLSIILSMVISSFSKEWAINTCPWG